MEAMAEAKTDRLRITESQNDRWSTNICERQMIDGVEGERPSNTTPMTTNNIKEQEATKTKSTNLRWKHIQYMQQNLLGQGPAKAHVKNQYCL